MSRHLAHAQLLFQQGRYPEAEQPLKNALSEDPESTTAMSMLAMCLSENKKINEALDLAQQAVGREPDEYYCHFALGHVLLDMKRYKDASIPAREAIRLEPDETGNYSLLASIHLFQSRWNDVLDVTELGLRIDAEDENLNNLRAQALVKLGRQEEAGLTLDANLQRRPDNAATHANKGWALLHEGNPEQAMEHFREALRLDPDMEYARQGIIQALRARHFIYRPLLSYFLWMSTMSSGAQWGIIIGAVVLVRILRLVGEKIPELEPLILPILILYGVFVFLSWTAQPLFNLLLRLHPLGKLALTDEERRVSSVIGLILLTGIFCLGTGVVIDVISLVIFGLVGISSIIMIAGTFNCNPGKGRNVLLGYTIIAIGIGLAACVIPLSKGSGLLLIYLLSIFLFGWIANAVSMRT
jgi:tetratricopeptide (TPR) repeat protein